MTQLYDIPALNTHGLAAMIMQASEHNISARLQYFYDLFPYAESLPGSLAVMDHNSKILACNEYAWKQVKLENATQLIDHTSDEVERALGWRESLVGRARREDLRVLEEGQSIHQETIVEGAFEKVLVCKKQAIFSESGKPLGVLSLALPVKVNYSKISFEERTKRVFLHLKPGYSVFLSMREFLVLREILNGRSCQDIASKMFISLKTVETYEMRIKVKLGCDKKREVIPLLIKLDLASAIMEYTLS